MHRELRRLQEPQAEYQEESAGEQTFEEVPRTRDRQGVLPGRGPVHRRHNPHPGGARAVYRVVWNITARDRETSTYRRIGVALSVVAILAGLVMIGATFAGGGPSPLVGVLCGVLLVAYGLFRLYWTLKR